MQTPQSYELSLVLLAVCLALEKAPVEQQLRTFTLFTTFNILMNIEVLSTLSLLFIQYILSTCLLYVLVRSNRMEPVFLAIILKYGFLCRNPFTARYY